MPKPPTEAVSTPNATNRETPYASIRQVDFRNFSYTGPNDYSESFSLTNGEKAYIRDKEDGVFLGKTFYHDLTGDDREEAVIEMSIQTGGSAIPNLVFIYTLDGGEPKELWKFATGDRAEGGLKSVHTRDGIIFVELFGRNKFVNGKWDSKLGRDEGLCCPTMYTRTKFKWNGEKFEVNGDPELFDVDQTSIRKN